MQFRLPIPASHLNQAKVQKEGTKFICSERSVSTPLQIFVSRPYVSMDGLAYVAFSRIERTEGTAACASGAALDPAQITVKRDDGLVLWQIHPDGTLLSFELDSFRGGQSPSAAMRTVLPTGSLVTDNKNGMLVPVRVWEEGGSKNANEPDQFVYHMNQHGEVMNKLSLPKYGGRLHDEMVGGEEVFFAARGGVLIAFDISKGRELWRWESGTPEISVFAALADGGCLVQTPTALVQVNKTGTESKELVKGKAMMDWQGHMYIKHN